MATKPLILLSLALLLAVSVSGCTGLDGFCIPGIMGNCGGTVEYENDVLVIKTLDVVPLTISTGQQLRLSAWIENKGGETVPQKEIDDQYKNVEILLYDTCEGLFKEISANCPTNQGGSPIKNSRGCKITSILPKQTIPISWNLVANDKDKIPLETSCNLKIYVKYPYQTKSMTSITFIDYTEYQRMIDENKFSAITSYITEGYGPMKPYLTVEDIQPVPVDRTKNTNVVHMAFQIKNKGSGFLSAWKDQDIPAIEKGDIKIYSNTEQYNIGEIVSNEIKVGDKTDQNQITLIGKESPKQTFQIESPQNNQIEKVATYYVTTSIDYMYEFRKEIKVTIKPPKITG